MPIYEVTDTDVVQRCSNCNQTNRIALTELQAGVPSPDGSAADPRLVALPACPSCKSGEFLIRSSDNDPPHPAPGSFGHLHRLLVDHLQSVLVTTNRVNPKLFKLNSKVADQGHARPLDKATRDKFFPDGAMKIPLPAGAPAPAPKPSPGGKPDDK
jgi:hypothetical protein